MTHQRVSKWVIHSLIALSLFLSLFVSVGAAPPSEPPSSPPSPSSLSPSAQNSTYTIRLRSREFTPEPGLSAQERDRLNQVADQEGAYIHAFLQTYTIPSPDKQAELAEQGIDLLTYVTNRTWIARVPEDDLERVVDTPGVRWLGAIQPDDKLAPEIRQEAFGDWYYDEAQDVLVVFLELHQDVDLDVAQELVLDQGGMVRGYTSAINGVTAELPRQAVRTLAADDRVLWIEAALPAFTPTNDGSRTALNVDVLQPAPYNPAPSYNLDGSGIDVLVYDGGQVDSHPDFGSRLTNGDTTSVADHATHVAGTVGGDGSQSAGDGGSNWQWRGMAPNVDIVSYGFQYGGPPDIFFYEDPGDIQTDWDDAKNVHGADLGTASLGTNVAPNGFACSLEGNYGAASQLLDNIVRGSLGEPYIATWANGNERGAGTCGTQYNTTAPPACAKNPIQVGATNSNDNSMTNFSSWGPCDDGRLKPIVSAPGCQSTGDGAIHSTVANIFTNYYWSLDCDGSGDDFCYPYDNMCGTSMATPAVAGVVSLMLQQYRDTYNRADEFLPSTAKALLMNTATDLGNAGPDYQFGYGHVDAQTAVDAIIDGLFREGTIAATGEQDEYVIQVPSGATELQVSLAWDDPGVAPLTTPALVNDLDLTLLDPGGGLNQPWVLDPSNPGNAATTGTDAINNQEQVTVNSPQDGVWRVRVDGTAVPDAPQRYSLVATYRMISLDIADPTQATPADVGYYADPEKLLINLDLRDKFGGPLSTTIDSATDLSFDIGGDPPASVFPGGNVGSHYWVWITPPTKGSAGCHDLEVTLFGVTSDMEQSAVCYGSTALSPQDMMLVIDKSGSMSWADKMDSTKSASEFFVTAASVGDMIGVTAFSTTSNLEYSLTTITGTNTKDDANTAIDNLTAYGLTAMGPGMQTADSELSANGDPAHRPTIVLLSDGRENQSPYWRDISNTLPSDLTIHTVALGPDGDPDEPLLSDTAAQYNGNYYRVPTGEGFAFNNSLATELPNVLADVYRSAAEETYGWERLWDAGGEVGPGCRDPSYTDTYQVYVEQGLSEVLFAVHWSAVEIGPVTMYLTRPDGTPVDPSDPDVIEHRQVASGFGTGHEQYRMDSPQNGYWTVELDAQQSYCNEYVAVVEARSKSELSLLSPTPGQHIGYCQNVPLLTSFMGPTKPISGAQVRAELIGPLTGGEPYRMSLFDDGQHGDGQADDGLYGNTFMPCQGRQVQQPAGVGSYQIRAMGRGINENGEPITRSLNGGYYASGSTTSAPDPDPARILLVDDDANSPNVRGFYTNTLDNVGVSYDVWDVVEDGPVVSPTLSPYHTVIWFTGQALTDTLAAGDEAALASFLEQGGKLFLSSQHYFFDVGVVNTFMQDYLHVSAVQNDVGASSVEGVAGNAVGDGLGPYPLSPTAGSADRLTPATPGGQDAFVNEADSTIAVSFTDGDYCSLFGAFPFEQLAAADSQEMMESILTWHCWDPGILASPAEVDAPVWTAGQSQEDVTVSNPGQGRLTWVVNSGPIHLWAVTDADGQVPTFLNSLDPTLLAAEGLAPAATNAITDDVQLEVCTVSSGVSDCCSGPTCTQDELLNQDVLIIYSNQAFVDPSGLGDMLADFVDAGGAVILANDALVQGTNGLSGRFMNEDYSPLESSSDASNGAASLDTFDAGHPLMSGVTAANALSHLDVFTTSGDVEIVATWDTGEPFVAVKRHDPAPVPGRVIAVNAPLDDGQWGGDLDEIVTNGVQWLSDNVRDLPWLEPVCGLTPPIPDPSPGIDAIDYTCPPVGSGEDWNLTLFLDGSMLVAPPGTTLQGKLFIEHNVSDQGRINIPVTGNLQDPVDLSSVTIAGESMGEPGTYTFTTSYQPLSATTPITYLWDNGSTVDTAVRNLNTGVHTLMVTATNVSSQVTDTHTITISTPSTCTELSGVTLSRTTSGTLQVGDTVMFSADVVPDGATKPYTYTVDYGDGTSPMTDTSSADPLMLSHTFNTSGTFTVQVRAWNCDMSTPVSDMLEVEVGMSGPVMYDIYIPVVFKES